MRAFQSEGGPGRNHKTDRKKVLSSDQRAGCKKPHTTYHCIGGSFQDHTEFGNQKCPAQVSDYHCLIYIVTRPCYSRKLAVLV
jgi:hypothetical protein